MPYWDEEKFSQKHWKTTLLKSFKESYESEGLLKMIPFKKIKVSEEGKPFVRNICMPFDLKLI